MNRDLSLEYVLGIMPPDETSDFEKELARDPKLYQSIVDWQNHLLFLADSVPKEKNPVKYKDIQIDTPSERHINLADNRILVIAAIVIVVIKINIVAYIMGWL